MRINPDDNSKVKRCKIRYCHMQMLLPTSLTYLYPVFPFIDDSYTWQKTKRQVKKIQVKELQQCHCKIAIVGNQMQQTIFNKAYHSNSHETLLFILLAIFSLNPSEICLIMLWPRNLVFLLLKVSKWGYFVKQICLSFQVLGWENHGSPCMNPSLWWRRFSL